eukprot:5039145-Ditylum_brightwellii.AAC.1
MNTVIQTTKPTTSFLVATSYLKSQTLLFHPETATIIKHFHTDFLKLQSFILRKDLQLKCFDTDEDFVPRSCRIKFSLNPSDNLKELTGFTELKDKCTELVNNLQQQLKQKVNKHLKLEIKQKKDMIKHHAATSFKPA